MSTKLTEQDLDQRLRTALRTVAATLEAEHPAIPARRRRGRRLFMGLGAAAIVIPAAAAAYLHIGPEYVDRIPPATYVVAGSADGGRYWLVENTRLDECGQPVTGVEFIDEEDNFVGQEWSTIGNGYGDPTDCGNFDPTRWLADSAYWEPNGTFVGDTFALLVAVHPDVTSLRVTIGDDEPSEVGLHLVDGAGYAVVEVPAEEEYTVELLIGGEVVPGSARTRTAPPAE